MRTRPLGAGLLVLAGLMGMAACGGGSSTAATTTTTTEPPSTTLPAMPATFDWWSPATTPLGNGWSIIPCAPPAPASRGKPVCLKGPEGHTAFLEHFRFTAPPDPDVTHHAPAFVADFTKDRTTGCGQQYRVTAEPVVPLSLPDGAAVRYGFTGGAASAPDTERTLQWAGIRGSVLVIVTISGYDPGSCLPNNGQGSLDDLNGIIPGLDALIHASGLPPLTPR